MAHNHNDIMYYGSALPPTTGYDEGTLFLNYTTGDLYVLSGSTWTLIGSGGVLTSVQNDGTGVALVSDTGTAHTAKVRSLKTTGNGITLAISASGEEIELNFDKAAASVASLDSSGKVIERLSYEGIPNGVPQLTAASEVAQPPSGQGFASLTATDALAGEFFVGKGGVMYKAQGGYAGGPAILDSSGKIQDRLAYEATANGVATLDSSGKLLQPRRVLHYARQQGATDGLTITAHTVLPDPHMTYTAPADATGTVILKIYATVSGQIDSVGGNSVWLRIAVSTDGGTTWTIISGPDTLEWFDASRHFNVHARAHYELTPGASITVAPQLRVFNTNPVLLPYYNWREMIIEAIEI